MDPVQDPNNNLPPTIMPTTEEAVPPPPPTPVIEPPTTPTPVPPSDGGDNAQIVKPKKKWGTGALIGSVAALMVLVVGLGFGLWQVRQNQKIKPSKATDYEYITFHCDQCASDRRCQTPDVGVNPTFSTGNNPGTCNQVDRRPQGSTGDYEVVSLCDVSCSGSGPGPTPTPPGSTCNSTTTAEVNINGGGWTSGDGSVKSGDNVQFRASPADGRTALLLNVDGQTGSQCSSDPGGGTACPGGPIVMDDRWWGNRVGQTISVRAFQFGSNWYTSLGGSCEDTLNLTINKTVSTPIPTPTPTPTPTSVPGSQCQRMVAIRGTEEIASANWATTLRPGDVVVFRGFAGASNTTVTAINFSITVNGGTPQQVPGTNFQLVGGVWQADTGPITIVAGSYSVVATPIYP